MRLMVRIATLGGLVAAAIGYVAAPVPGQEYGTPDRAAPGDAMIQDYLAREAERLHDAFAADIASPEHWRAQRPQLHADYLYMLGLDPMPEATPLEATVTGTLEYDGVIIEMLHYQSLPGLYVTGNLYRPADAAPGARLPAVFYVCGHSHMGRDGNKTAYQSHGLWFARHGYVCLVVDTLQLGEIAGIHHGTYREGRWWWLSRGYTPSGVEALNGIRGIDYLVGRDDVDPERIAVTGISGGGAVTFWIAAADERVAVAVPVSGMADLPSYVGNRVINGHCDCMFFNNAFRWPWVRIAALVAPRPMLFVNSDADAIFPMDANDRVINRLERIYSLYGAGDYVAAQVSIGGHAYREDIRQGAYRFINTYLKDDPRPVTDSEVDLPEGPRGDRSYAIEPQRLRVFPTDEDVPAGARNGRIDEEFVPLVRPEPPAEGEYDAWRADLVAELRRVTFGYLPEEVPAARRVEADDAEGELLETEAGIRIRLGTAEPSEGAIERVVLLLRGEADDDDAFAAAAGDSRLALDGSVVYTLEPRGTGGTRWTRRNPPNYVERSHVLLGRTVDTARVWDALAAAGYLRETLGEAVEIHLAGRETAALVAAAAAALDPRIAGAVLIDPPASFMDETAPPLLNVLRVCDVAELVGLIAPRPLSLHADDLAPFAPTRAIYAAAKAEEALK